MGNTQPGSAMRLSFLASLVCLCLTPVGVFAYAETFYVCQGGDGSAPKDGTAAHAWSADDVANAAHWSSAVDTVDGKLGPGDRLFFMSNGGTITRSSGAQVILINASGTSGNPITLEGDGSALIDGQGVMNALSGTNKDYITLKNLKMAHGYNALVGAYACNYWTIDTCTLSYCTPTTRDTGTLLSFCGNGWWIKNSSFMHTTQQHLIYMYSQTGPYGSCDNLIEHNYFADAGEDGIHINGVDTQFTGNVIRYNFFYNNGWSDIEISTGDGTEVYENIFVHDQSGKFMAMVLGDDSIGTAHVKSTKVWNNLFYGYFEAMIYMANYHTTGSPCITELYNNIFFLTGPASSARYFIDFEVSNAAIGASDYNVYWTTYGSTNLFKLYSGATPGSLAAWQTAMSGLDMHSLQADPLLVGPSVGDYHLQSMSPCRGAGKDVSLANDYDGVSIPQGVAPDIGPFEYSSSNRGASRAAPTGLRKQ